MLSLLLVLACAPHPVPPAVPAPLATEAEDLAAARALFDANIRAIQERDRDAYLACYADSERLIRTGPDGPALGFAALAEGTPATGSDAWPERLDADGVQVHWLAPGVVYGTYAYRVTFDGDTTAGLSERVFLRQSDGEWRIAVSTAFEAPPPPAE
ncbi:MAG: ketosteroid isomerase-like protein [Myxococcota bacterium]|jgi:ketosteroid isomerase-like protein